MIRRVLAPGVAAYAGALLALLWARTLEPAYLAGALAAAAAGAALLLRSRRARRGLPAAPADRWVYAALLTLALAAVAGLISARRLGRLPAEWPQHMAARQARLAATLDREVSRVLERARLAAEQAAASADQGGAALFAGLAELRSRTGVDALAVFGESGELVAWAGEHRGVLPLRIKIGGPGIAYEDRPLFSYLYVSAVGRERGGRAMAAVLLSADPLLRDREPADLAGRFEARTGARPAFLPGPGPRADWSMVQGREVVFHARFQPVTQGAWRAGVARAGRRWVTLGAGAALVLLLIGWLRAAGGAEATARWPRQAAALGVLAAIALTPWSEVLGAESLFSPGLFLLPVPGNVSLGTLLALLLPAACLAAARRPAPLEGRALLAAVLLGVLSVAVGFAAGVRLLLGGASPALLEGGAGVALLWGGLLGAGVLLLGTLAGLALPQAAAPPGHAGRHVRSLLLALGLAASLALMLWGALRWRPERALPPWSPALWAAPLLLLALALAREAGRGSRLIRWLAAGWLAATAVIPQLWAAQMHARFQAAERELAALGSRADPYLDYLLRRFAEEVGQAAQAGGEQRGTELLYRAWVRSGLAGEAYPAQVTMWTPDGRVDVELEVGSGGASRRSGSAGVVSGIVSQARAVGRPVWRAQADAPGLDRVLAVPLADGRVISVVVPPRRSLEAAGAFPPLAVGEPRPEARLTLVPARSAEPTPSSRIRWHPTDQGWRSEAIVRYPEGEYHAHLELRFPPMGVRLARAILLLALSLAGLALLWVAGRVARGEPPGPPGGWTAWLGGFRARVTLALFAFFLLPTALFGLVAYRALAGEVARAARMVAERAVAQAAAAFPDSTRELGLVRARTGEEVLYYLGGELASASSPQALTMGVFGAWMPARVYQTLVESGEEISAVEMRRLGRHPYLVAYRRFSAGALAVPVSLAAGDAVVRQRELAHLILFAALLGGLLSLTLSVAVGRALAGPIGRLRRAAGAVGAGRLSARLPEDRTDEFGELFRSFNRMVRRLRRARAQELHTARVLAWGEMARQVAHEIKNPLTPIKLSVQHLRRAFADRRPDFDQILNTSAERMLTEIDRLSDIARAFSRYGAPAEAAGPLEEVDATSVVREALTLYGVGEGGTRYLEQAEAGLPPVLARGAELREVLLNLLENARFALDGRGTVRVTIARAGGNVELIISDDGPGIPPDLLPRIFEPQFSARSAGTGLGLAIVRRLVEGWGGSVTAETRPGGGTAVRVRLQPAGATGESDS
ncbi:MAG: HAMP domain-containing histidine kinase [Gemmatimonadetes bacterium]|nr:HAMP domain-containing histidine kinase [Gemmatimonadota bacterium]